MRAHEIADSGNVPDEYVDAVAEMVAQHQIALDEVARLGPDAQVPAERVARDEEGQVITGEDGQAQRVALVNEHNEPIMEPHPLIERYQGNGIHAYRYEQQDDGSVLAVYVKNDDTSPKMVGFDNIEDASRWSPRDE